jgi:hypothetical protein
MPEFRFSAVGVDRRFGVPVSMLGEHRSEHHSLRTARSQYSK